MVFYSFTPYPQSPLQFSAAGLMELKRWVLAWGGNVKVLEPAELRQIVRDEIKNMAGIY